MTLTFGAFAYALGRWFEMKKPKDMFLSARAFLSGSQSSRSLAEWFRVEIDETTIRLQVNSPNRSSWKAEIKWERIIRVCFKAGDLYDPDVIFVFVDERPESYAIPMEAHGASALWNEIIQRQLFDAAVAIEAAKSTNKLFCCPAME